jgi:hypothetical protein
MALTREFRATLLERAQRDAEFRQAMLKEGIDTMLAGDVETGKAILRDYINAAVGFGQLAEATHIPAKSLMRMLGPKGNLCDPGTRTHRDCGFPSRETRPSPQGT